jgi:zinc transporter ZupT
LLKTSQLLSKTFLKTDYNPDLDYLVNPKESDYNRISKPRSGVSSHSQSLTELVNKPSSVLPYFLLFGLCVDGLFEGLAISVQTSWERTLFVAFSILLNKCIVGFTMGLSLKKADLDLKSFIRFVFLFALFPPLGIVLGYFFTENLLVQAIFLAISSGAFIYVSSSVVVIEEFAITNYRWSKYFLFLLGAILTAVIKIVGHI